jgi:hypothetical protein
MSKWHVSMTVVIGKAAEDTMYSYESDDKAARLEEYEIEIPAKTREEGMEGAQRMLTAIIGS